MARLNSIESHPQRQKIIDALVSGTPYRDIEAWTRPTVTRGSLSRFKATITETTRDKISAIQSKISAIAINDKGLADTVRDNVTRGALVAAVDPFLQSAMRQTERRAKWIEAIETSTDGVDYGTLAKLDRNDQTGLELHARLAGRLDNAGDKLTVQIVMPAAPGASIADDYEGVTVDIKPAK